MEVQNFRQPHIDQVPQRSLCFLALVKFPMGRLVLVKREITISELLRKI